MAYEMKPYLVYVKTDEAGRIIDINSSAFLSETDGWTEIDSGHGDQYHHAQGNYFNKPIMDMRGIYHYKLEDGKPVERTQEEMDADDIPPDTLPSEAQRIAALEEQIEMLLSGVTEDA